MAAAEKQLDPAAPAALDEPITTGSPMPPAEPYHRVAEAKEGEVFDPNAAARLARGEDVGLQDSEAIHPAHWNVTADPAYDKKVVIQKLERQIARLKEEVADVKKGDAA